MGSAELGEDYAYSYTNCSIYLVIVFEPVSHQQTTGEISEELLGDSVENVTGLALDYT